MCYKFTMYPIIAEIGPFTLHSFGVMLAIAILVGTWWLTRETRRLGDPRITVERIQNLVWWIVIGVILGGRLMYCAERIAQGNDRFVSQPWTMFYVWEGGLTMYGGFLGVFIAVIGFAYKYGIRVLRLCDLVAPAAFLGQAIGRWGCWFAGDDYGRPTDSWIGVIFPVREGSLIPAEYIGTTPLHPTQIYMSIKALIVFGILTYITRHKKYDGQVAGWSFMVYAVLRFIVEFFRGDAGRAYIGPLSPAQFTAIFAFFLGLAIVLLAPRRTLRDDYPNGVPTPGAV